VTSARHYFNQDSTESEADPIGLEAATSRRTAGRGLRFLDTSTADLESRERGAATAGSDKDVDPTALLDAYSILWDRWWSWRQEDTLVSALANVIENEEGLDKASNEMHVAGANNFAGVSVRRGEPEAEMGFSAASSGTTSRMLHDNASNEMKSGKAYQDLQRNRMQRGMPNLTNMQLGPRARSPGHALRRGSDADYEVRVLTKRDRKRLKVQTNNARAVASSSAAS